eukprot:TRINITY_DN1547_c0_g1_i1.p1 TRINITY_DN1547_c0_g1~~TRINITY_DN1547_c0_g1_i1.p1  ORF type:complete len:467 (+),score=91.20 TRINITY_DN1547_c0_g1_i1:162-1562(+)
MGKLKGGRHSRHRRDVSCDGDDAGGVSLQQNKLLLSVVAAAVVLLAVAAFFVADGTTVGALGGDLDRLFSPHTLDDIAIMRLQVDKRSRDDPLLLQHVTNRVQRLMSLRAYKDAHSVLLEADIRLGAFQRSGALKRMWADTRAHLAKMDRCKELVTYESQFYEYQIRSLSDDILQTNTVRPARALLPRFVEINDDTWRFCDYNHDIALRVFLPERFVHYATEQTLEKILQQPRCNDFQGFYEDIRTRSAELDDIGDVKRNPVEPKVWSVTVLPVLRSFVNEDNMNEMVEAFNRGQENPRVYYGHKWVLQRTARDTYIVYQAFNRQFLLANWLQRNATADAKLSPTFLRTRERYGLGKELSTKELVGFLDVVGRMFDEVNTRRKWSQLVETYHRMVFGLSNHFLETGEKDTSDATTFGMYLCESPYEAMGCERLHERGVRERRKGLYARKYVPEELVDEFNEHHARN